MRIAMNCYRKFANVFRFMAEIPRILTGNWKSCYKAITSRDGVQNNWSGDNKCLFFDLDFKINDKKCPTTPFDKQDNFDCSYRHIAF